MGSAKNRLVLGDLASPIITLEGDCIRSVTGILSSDILAQELANDTIEAVLDSVGWFTELSPADEDEPLTTLDGDPLTLADNAAAVYMGLPADTSVWWYHGDRCLGQFYLKEIRRTGKTQFTLTAQSIVGVMDNFPFYGYVALNGYPIASIVGLIFMTDGMRDKRNVYHIDATPAISAAWEKIEWADGVKDIIPHGAIPICTKRDALRHLFFAYSLTFRYADDGHLIIAPIDSIAPNKIPSSRIFAGGATSLQDRADRVELVEHRYWVPRDLQFDDSAYIEIAPNVGTGGTVSERYVEFSTPIIWYASGGADYVRSSPYAAILSENKALRGLPFGHAKTILFEGKQESGTVISVTDAYMVTQDTSAKLLDRLYRYYSGSAETEMSISIDGESLLQNYIYENPYAEQETGYLTEMSITASGILKCDAKLISGFSPDAEIASVSSYVILTGDGEWQVPDAVFSSASPMLRVVLIGGGSGGAAGGSGQDGNKNGAVSAFRTKQNKAGSRGAAGIPGKFLTLSLHGDNIKQRYSYSCGLGGSGGTVNGAPGAGTETLFGGYSSADGIVRSTGVANLLNGDVYAKSGEDNDAPSGNSGYTEPFLPDGYISPLGGNAYDHQISDAVVNLGGGPMRNKTFRFNGGQWTATTGNGGGAGHGEDGKNPGWPSINSSGKITTGNGGNGGNSTLKPPRWIDYLPTAYGYGGRGGYGGGAGGDAGIAFDGWPPGIASGTPGKGGAGGPGGDGSPGCIIIYY
nr:MAG TPA: hypothetical protein [Caudoviricetes sp.]